MTFKAIYHIYKKVFTPAFAVILSVGILAAGCGLSPTTQTGGEGTPASGHLLINEVVTSNRYSLTDDHGNAPDWIEIYNPGPRAVNLVGYGLTDNENDPFKYIFPSLTLEAGAYTLVYAVGQDGIPPQNAGPYAPYKLSQQGETLFLVEPDGDIVDQLTVPTLPTDMSWARSDDGVYRYHLKTTPGAPNSGPVSDTTVFGDAYSEYSVIINEVMPNNKSSIVDIDGDRSDWVEIKNNGDQAVNLENFSLSDDENDPRRWMIPAVEIAPGQLMVIFLSGKDRTDPAAELHASFKLGSSDTFLTLFDSDGLPADRATWQLDMPGNATRGRTADGQWAYFLRPTPGQENTANPVEVLDVALGLDPDGLWINEVVAVKQDDSVNDWVEIKNGGSEAVNLAGYGLTDSQNNPYKFTFPDVTIQPGGYLVAAKQPQTGQVQLTMSISGSGDELMLIHPDGTILDTFQTGLLTLGLSSGRAEGDLTGTRFFFDAPTPGAANTGAKYTGYTADPVFLTTGGYARAGDSVEIQVPQGATVRYTVDGSVPTTSSPVYGGAIPLSKNVTIRARAWQDGRLPSNVATATYLLDAPHDIPVVCLSSAPAGLFSDSIGIFADGPGWTETFPHVGANFWKGWERPIHLEFYEADGTLGTAFDAGLQVFGQYSRAEAQKSLAIYLRGRYGQSSVTYPFFRDYDVTTFESLLLRTSGQDWVHTKIRDAFFAQAIKGELDLEYQEYRPVAVYINGEYWGLYNMREKISSSYLQQHYGVDPDNVDRIKGNRKVQAGTDADFQALRDYVKSHDLSVQANYDYVAARVDVDNFMDYIIVQTYFNNTDTGNLKFWKEKGEDGRWRWILYDMDWGLFPSTYKWNMIEEYFNPAGHGVGNNFYSFLQCGLLDNPGWRERFIERYAYCINNVFEPDRLCALVDEMAAEIETEMPRHVERFKKPSSVSSWQSKVDQFKQMIREKPDITKAHLKKFFGLSNARMAELFPDD